MPDSTPLHTAAHWYVVQTKPKAEMSLLRLINAKKDEGEWGIHAYLPMKQTPDIPTPLFRGYLFVKHDQQGFQHLQYTTGVKRYVRFGGYPTAIPEKDISLIQLVESNFNHVEFKENYLTAGQSIRIKGGVLNGQEGILLENARGKRVALEIENLGYSLTVNVPPRYIIPLPSGGSA